jgi:hypothetical protein
MVIKTVLLTGSLVNGELDCFIDPSFCDLRVGIWQMSLDSINALVRNEETVTETYLRCNASVAISWFKSFQQNKDTYRLELLPSPLTLVTITQTRNNQNFSLTPSRARHWMAFQQGEQQFKVIFKILSTSNIDPATKKPSLTKPDVLKMDVHIVLLLEKVAP